MEADRQREGVRVPVADTLALMLRVMEEDEVKLPEPQAVGVEVGDSETVAQVEGEAVPEMHCEGESVPEMLAVRHRVAVAHADREGEGEPLRLALKLGEAVLLKLPVAQELVEGEVRGDWLLDTLPLTQEVGLLVALMDGL